MIVLVDSSVWIDFLRPMRSDLSDLESVIREGRAAICPVIWLELWRGTRSKAEEAALNEMRRLSLSLEVDHETWTQAAGLSRVALQNGLNCPLADVLIVACARRHGVKLMHRDKHIEALLGLCGPPG